MDQDQEQEKEKEKEKDKDRQEYSYLERKKLLFPEDVTTILLLLQDIRNDQMIIKGDVSSLRRRICRLIDSMF